MALSLRRACIQANVRLMQSLRVVCGLGIPAETQKDDQSTGSRSGQATMSSKTNLGSQFLIIPGWKQKSVCFNLDFVYNLCLMRFICCLYVWLRLGLCGRDGSGRGKWRGLTPTALVVSLNIKNSEKELFPCNRSLNGVRGHQHSQTMSALELIGDVR